MLQSKHGGRTGTGLAHLAVKMNLMVQCLTEGIISQLRETVAQQEKRIQMLEKKVSCLCWLVWLQKMQLTT